MVVVSMTYIQMVHLCGHSTDDAIESVLRKSQGIDDEHFTSSLCSSYVIMKKAKIPLPMMYTFKSFIYTFGITPTSFH